jgi:hypothetical protein
MAFTLYENEKIILMFYIDKMLLNKRRIFYYSLF